MERDIIKDILPEMKENVLLKKYTTFRIGGRARYFLEAKDEETLRRGVRAMQEFNIPFLVIGGGSNLLVSDKGYNGMVFKISLDNISLKDRNKVVVQSGARLSSLISFSLLNKLSGLEWGSGIPGSVGGAVYGNAGGFGKTISNLIISVKALNITTGKIERFNNKDCVFGYRDSLFKRLPFIVLEVEVGLSRGCKDSIEREMKKILEYRKKKHPREFSAGSVFKNYRIKSEKEKECFMGRFPELKEIIASGIIPSGFLIEKCGLKGEKVGEVMISEIHSNFIINSGEGKATDVKKLIELAKKKVKQKFDISIEEEIQYIGE